MKTLNLIIALFFISSINAQNFKVTDEYQLSNYDEVLNTTKIDYTKTFDVYLLKDGEPLSKLISLSKNDLDNFLDTKIEVLKNPKLNNVKKVVKVTFEFLDSCVRYESHYFLITDENLVIKLPKLSFRQCEYATEKVTYIFPSEKYGKKNRMLQSLCFLDENKQIEGIEIEKEIVWKEKSDVLYTLK